MKILQVIGSMNPLAGGPCEGVRNQANMLAKEGGTIMEVVCLDDPESDYLSREKLCVHALGKGRASWNYHPALRPWLEKNLPRFDAIILNGLWQYPGFVLSRLAKQPGNPPYFLFPHGMLDPWFQQDSKRRLKALRNRLYWRLVEQHVVRKAEGLLFTSEEEMRLAAGTFRPYQPRRQINVGYGISKPPEYQQKMAQAFDQKCLDMNGKPYLLFLGRIHPKKGIHFLIEAYAEVCRSKNGARIPSLVIAGPDLEGEYGKKMQKLASEICPANSVFWPGMLDGDAKWGAFYNCEASVLPSNQENFGIAVVETLACGRPVLISDQVNIWREIKNDGAALVEKNSVLGTTQLLMGWNGLSPDARSNMAAQAQPCFQRHFSIESMTRKLMLALTPQKSNQ